MVFVKLTLGDCKQALADRHDNGTLPTSSATLAFWTRILNRGVLYCADKLRLNKETTLTTSSGTIALPDDFLVINDVTDASGTALKMVDATAVHTGYVFWITGNQTTGFFLNTPTDTTYTVDYAFKPAPMVSDSDVCVIPDIEAPVAYAYAMIRKGESDPFEDADIALRECDARLKEIQSATAINTNSIGLTWE